MPQDPRMKDAVMRTPQILESHRQLLEDLKTHILELKAEVRKIKEATVRAKKNAQD